MSEAGRAKTTQESIDLNELVTDCARMLAKLLDGNVIVSLDLDPCLEHVRGNQNQLGQLLLNLAVNARDAMPSGGELTIQTNNVELRAGDPRFPGLATGMYVSLIVADTGCGMTDEVKARLFEPFFTTKEAGKGIGLGLTAVHGIVRSVGGGIAVESTPGVGTAFEIILPLSDIVAPTVVLGNGPAPSS